MSTFLNIIAYVNKKALRLINGPSEQTKRVRAWTRDDGEELRLSYDLNENSLIMDVGGYEGKWAEEIHKRYGSKIFIFEPVSSFCADITKRLGHEPDIILFPFGLSGTTTTTDVLLDANSSSVFEQGVREGADHETIKLVAGSDFFRDHDVKSVDLLKLNIEGGEYDLLDNLIENRLVARIDNIQVQFHEFVPNAAERMKKIQDALLKTHHTTYQYPFVWENWKRNN